MVQQAGRLLQICMEEAASLLVPLRAKIKVGKTWGSLEPFYPEPCWYNVVTWKSVLHGMQFKGQDEWFCKKAEQVPTCPTEAMENSPPALPISWSLPFNIVASCSALSMHSTRSMAVAVVRRCLQLWTWRCMIGPSHWTVYWCVPFVRFVFRNSFVFFVLTIFLKLQLIEVILSVVPAVGLSHFYCYGCALLSSLIVCEIKCTVTSSLRIRHERPVIVIDGTCCMPAIIGLSYIVCKFV